MQPSSNPGLRICFSEAGEEGEWGKTNQDRGQRLRGWKRKDSLKEVLFFRKERRVVGRNKDLRAPACHLIRTLVLWGSCYYAHFPDADTEAQTCPGSPTRNRWSWDSNLGSWD